MNDVTVTWENPADGPAPEGVYVEVSGPDAFAKVIAIPGAETQARVSGLRNGVTYSLRVTTATRHGSAAPTAWIRATPTTGAEGVVAGLIVEFTEGIDPAVGTQLVPGEARVDQVDLSVSAQVSDDTMLVALSEPVDMGTAEKIAADLTSDPAVKWAEPDEFFFTAADASSGDLAQSVSVPADAQYGTEQWNLWDTYGIGIGATATSMTDAWVGPRGDGVTVAVIDTGITEHPDLNGQLVSGYDFVSSPQQLAANRQSNAASVPFDGDYVDTDRFGGIGRDANPSDPGDWREVAPVRGSSWHGTKMAGLISAAANDVGITGIAPNAKIQPVRALSWRGGLLSDIAASLTWASGGAIDGVAANATPAKVLNLSFAVQTICPTALQSAINGARERGSIVVAAAGNASDDAAKYAPGNCNGVITVGASIRDGMRADYSNYGPAVEISAPGGDAAAPVITTSNNGAQDSADSTTSGDFGTSVSAAHVSAAVAILASRNASLTPDAAKELLTGGTLTKDFAAPTCDTTNTDYSCGTGILSLAQVATVASGDEDFSMDFGSAASQEASAPSSATFDWALDGTMEVWFKPDACTGDCVVVERNRAYSIRIINGVLEVGLPEGNDTTWAWEWFSLGAPRLTHWQHVAVVKRGKVFEIYLDGQPARPAVTQADVPATGRLDFTIGNNPNDSAPFDGQIDEFRLWSKAWDADRIATDMHEYGAVSAVEFKAYFDFNEGPAGFVGPGTVVNRVSGAASTTNLRAVNKPLYANVKRVTTNGANTVVTFPRSYITAAGGWRAPQGITSVNALVVGGGGGGGSSHDTPGAGGGGAGGLIDRSSSPVSLVGLTSAMAVTVGMGGLGGSGTEADRTTYIASGNNGQPSTLGTPSSLNAQGGGAGGGRSSAGGFGGSGGGAGGRVNEASNVSLGGSGIAGQGTSGGSVTGANVFVGGGGGGGATTAGGAVSNSGMTGGPGGAGKSVSITGTAATYGVGGSGGTALSGLDGVAGASGTGNGGGGAGAPNPGYTVGGAGGSGIVIVSYTSVTPPTSCVPLTYPSSTYQIVEFSKAGTCSWTPPTGVNRVDVLAVGGGGGGGKRIGGGGGGGAVVSSTAIAVTGPTTVSVGAGGVGGTGTTVSSVGGATGGVSVFGSITAAGGGGGAGDWREYPGTATAKAPAKTGGGGGGGGLGVAAGAAGNPGGTGGSMTVTGTVYTAGGGGGGAAIPDTTAENGQTGTATTGGAGGQGGTSSITGATVTYGGGGGGGLYTGGAAGLSPGPGGSGGGGAGATLDDVTGRFGVDGLGGGGGGGSVEQFATKQSDGGDGGDGVVIIRYANPKLSLTIGAGQQPGSYNYATGWATTAPKVQLTTAEGAVVAIAGVSVTASFTASNGSATLSGATVTTDANGIADFSSLTLTGAVGAAGTLTFSATDFTSVTSSSVSIVKAPQTITFADPADRAYGAAAFTLTATSTSTLTVSIASQTTAVCTVSTTTVITVTVIAAGTCTLRASQAGDTNYNAATNVDQSFTVSKVALTLRADDESVAHGTAISQSYTLTSGALVGTDAISGVTYTYAGSGSTTYAASTTAPTEGGTYAVTPSAATFSPGSAANYTISYIAGAVTISSEAQTITFGALPDKTYGDAPFSVSATSTSSLTVSFASTTPAVCTVSASAVTLVSSGSCSITASQAGNANYAAAAPVTQSFTVALGSRTLAFTTPTTVSKTYGDAPFQVVATPSTGTGSPRYYVLTGTACAPDPETGVVTIIAAGSCTIGAELYADAKYSASATTVPVTVTVALANQAPLNMSSGTAILFGESLVLAATGGSGTGAVTFSVVNGTGSPGCAVSSGALVATGTGTCVVTATKAATTRYNATSSTGQVVTIGKAGQTLAFTSMVPDSPEPNDTYVPTAASTSTVTSSASGLTPIITAGGACMIASGTVTFTSAGTCTVTANQAGDLNFGAATAVSQVIVVGSLNQGITFPQPGNIEFGGASVAMQATASSGLTVTYALGAGTTNAACSVSTLGVVTPLAIGTCEIVAAQAGDTQFAAASAVTRALQVVAALPNAPTLTYGSASSQAITVGFTAPGFTGGSTVTAYEVVATPTPTGTPVVSTACTTSPCTISGLANGTTYTVTVAAITTVGTGPASSPSTALTPATAAFAVASLAAVPGNTSVALTWTALSSDQLGGGTFTRYEVYERISGTTSWTLATNGLTSQTTNTHTVTGLMNGTVYDFKVVAITSANSAEITGNTATVTAFPSTVPTAPRDAIVLATTATDVEFSWEVPLSDGGTPLTSPNYTVTVTGSTGSTAVTCTPTGTRCTVAGLTSGASYLFSVVANNLRGASPAATYRYNVPSSTATLSALLVTGTSGAVDLSPSFASSTLAYSSSVVNGVSSVTITPTTTDAGATVTVNGVAVAYGSNSSAIALAEGTNTITIVVTATDPRFTKTYQIVITRAASGGGGTTDTNGNSDGGITPTTPVDPPILDGQKVAVVVEGGKTVDVVLRPTRANDGWEAIGIDFDLQARGETQAGVPVPLAADRRLSVPQGGLLQVNGSGYERDSVVRAFLIPRAMPRSLPGLMQRSITGAIYVGHASVDRTGAFDTTWTVEMSVNIGDYVLQVNGMTGSSAVRSVNIATLVTPGKTVTMEAGLVQRAGFYQGQSDRLSKDGLRKVRAIVSSMPADARGVQVMIGGVSVGMDSFRENLMLAGRRAENLASTLKARGIDGQFTVSVTATFTSDSAERAKRPSVDVLTDANGKPLTTVTVVYQAPIRN